MATVYVSSVATFFPSLAPAEKEKKTFWLWGSRLVKGITNRPEGQGSDLGRRKRAQTPKVTKCEDTRLRAPGGRKPKFALAIRLFLMCFSMLVSHFPRSWFGPPRGGSLASWAPPSTENR